MKKIRFTKDHKCLECGKPAMSKTSRYCSSDCRKRYVKLHRVKYNHTCGFCKVGFISDKPASKFCGANCRSKHYQMIRNGKIRPDKETVEEQSAHGARAAIDKCRSVNASRMKLIQISPRTCIMVNPDRDEQEAIQNVKQIYDSEGASY